MAYETIRFTDRCERCGKGISRIHLNRTEIGDQVQGTYPCTGLIKVDNSRSNSKVRCNHLRQWKLVHEEEDE